jgi:hypothetical protein
MSEYVFHYHITIWLILSMLGSGLKIRSMKSWPLGVKQWQFGRVSSRDFFFVAFVVVLELYFPIKTPGNVW